MPTPFSPRAADGASAASPTRRWRRPRWSTLVLIVLAAWSAPRLLPHLGALVGVRSGEERRPPLELVTRDGRVITTDSLRGRVVLINVWATWCAPCRVEMPALQQIADSYDPDDVLVLGLSVDRGPAADVDAFLADRDITYPVSIIDGRTLDALGGVEAYPTSFLLDREGVVQHKVVGPIGPVTLRPALWRLRRASGSAK